MDQDRKNFRSLAGFFALMFLFVLFNDWALRSGIFPLSQQEYVMKIHQAIFNTFRGILFEIKIIYTLFFVALAVLVSPFKTKPSPNKKLLVSVLFFLFGALLLIGYLQSYPFYTTRIYPFILLATPFSNYTFFRYWIQNQKSWKSDDEGELVNPTQKKKDGVSMYLDTADGKRIYILNPAQGMLVVGGAGSGKTASILIPLIYQAIENNYAGIIYDYEGDPTEKGGAILTRHIINAKKKFPESKVKFAFINFVDPSTSWRCNPLSRRYLENPDGSLDKTSIIEIATVFVMNLDREGAKKNDFWYKNMLAMFQGVIYRLVNGYSTEYATIPHVISILELPITEVMEWISHDSEAQAMVSAISGAVDRGAEQQVAGVESTYKINLNGLTIPEIFWVLSEDEFNLDITRIEEPTMLCVGNSPKKQLALQAPISTILTTCKRLMNQLGKQRSIFMLDEAPTVYIDGLDNLPATARKKGVATIVGVQTVNQLHRGYGKENSLILTQNLGNIFCGGNSDAEYSKTLETIFGDYDKKDKNFSETDQGSMTTSYNVKKEKLLSANKIMQQAPGHFSGKIFGGEPPMFSTQFTYVEDPENADIPPIESSPLNSSEFLKYPIEERSRLKRGMIQYKYDEIKLEAKLILSQEIKELNPQKNENDKLFADMLKKEYGTRK